MNTTTENKLNVLKRGHLYFHTKLGRVERAVLQDNGNVVHRHHAETNVSAVTFFRHATREEIACYLGK